jgi:hypothetical protein
MVPDLPERHRRTVAVAVGLTLLANPFVVGALDVGDPDTYRYEATRVVAPDGTVDVPAGVDVDDPEVVCLDAPLRRACMLERAAAERGGLRYAEGLPRTWLTTEYEYVYGRVDGEDRFYRPTVTEAEDGGYRYGLERVATERALSTVGTPLDRVSPGVRAAVEHGEYVTSDPLPGAGELVRTDRGHYVVDAAVVRERAGERTPLVVALQWVAGGVGLLLVFRGDV